MPWLSLSWLLCVLASQYGDSPNAEHVLARAYIAFKTVEQVTTFSAEYDGHMFRDKQGECIDVGQRWYKTYQKL
jgi:hypothetical protein